LRGREFFEEIIRDNLDLGRPDRVQLIFDRVVTKKTPGAFRTRVIQDGVHPSLHIDYKNFDLKQYFNYLQKIGREINRHLLEVERAVLAAQPLTPGHVVVAPRRHVACFYDLDVEEQHGLWDLVSEVRRHVTAAQHVESVAIGFEDGEEDQGHTRVHVVPRRPGVALPHGIEWVAE
jgi:diadenosine tetraphosphate (Ap4A) HIT family hydrolase